MAGASAVRLRAHSHNSIHVSSLKQLQAFVLSHILPILPLSVHKLRSLVIRIMKRMHFLHLPLRKSKQTSLVFGSFRLYYNWCSSPPHSYSYVCYDPVFVAPTDELTVELAGEKGDEDCSTSTSTSSDEIDKLAELFIANCHEKFRLEKQDSLRRFQEMMARSV